MLQQKRQQPLRLTESGTGTCSADTLAFISQTLAVLSLDALAIRIIGQQHALPAVQFDEVADENLRHLEDARPV